jgi:hypothetical protein
MSFTPLTAKQSSPLAGTTETFAFGTVAAGVALILATVTFQSGGGLTLGSVNDSGGPDFSVNRQTAVSNIAGAITTSRGVAAAAHTATLNFAGATGAGIYTATFGVVADNVGPLDTSGVVTSDSGGTDFTVTTDGAITAPDGYDVLLIGSECGSTPTYTTPTGFTPCGSITDFNGMTGALFVRSYTGQPLTTRSVGVNTVPNEGSGIVILLASFKLGATLDQASFRIYADGTESASVAAAAQNTGATVALSVNAIVRLLLNATGDPASSAYQLEYKLSTDATYAPVPLPSAAAGVTFGAVGTLSSGTTSCTPAYPTGISAATSKLYCVVTGRSSTASTAPTMPAGWTKLADLENGVGTFGVDTGTRRVTIFRKDTVAGTESGTVTVSLAGSTTNTLAASIVRVEVPAGHTIDESYTTGADITNGTGFSAAGSAALSWAANDLLLVAVAQNIDTGTQTAQALTATGATFSRTNRVSTALADGNDHRQIIDTAAVTAGSGSSIPTYAYTISASGSGPVAFLRLRSVGPSQPVVISPSANIAASGEATTARLTPPAGKSTSDFVVGRIADDENPHDAVDLTVDDYTEVAWVVKLQSPAVDGNQYQFRVAGLNSYTNLATIAVGSTALNGTSSFSEAADTSAAAAGVLAAGASSTTEATNAHSATGALTVAGASGVTEAADAESSAGVLPVAATSSLTEADNAHTSTGALPIAGALGSTEADNTHSVAGALPIAAVSSISEAANTHSAAAALAIAGASSPSESSDTASSAGQVTAAAALATSIDDGTSSAGALPVAGALSAQNAADALGADAVIVGGGATTFAEAADGVQSAAALMVAASSIFTEQTENTAATGSASVAGSLSITEGADAYNLAGTFTRVADASYVESSLTLASTAGLIAAGASATAQAADTIAAAAGVKIGGASSITESGNTTAASGVLSIAGSSATTVTETLSATSGTTSSASAQWSEAGDVPVLTGRLMVTADAPLSLELSDLLATGTVAVKGVSSTVQQPDSVVGRDLSTRLASAPILEGGDYMVKPPGGGYFARSYFAFRMFAKRFFTQGGTSGASPSAGTLRIAGALASVISDGASATGKVNGGPRLVFGSFGI